MCEVKPKYEGGERRHPRQRYTLHAIFYLCIAIQGSVTQHRVFKSILRLLRTVYLPSNQKPPTHSAQEEKKKINCVAISSLQIS